MLKSMWIAISTYSIFPAPQIEWRDEHMRGAILFLPVVGILIGAALILWQRLCTALEAEATLFAAIATVLPLLLSGGIHMDGFMDTSDALASHQSRERMLEIMKDSHTGAFAVIGCACYLLVCFGLYSALFKAASFPVIGMGFILSRSLCSLCALTLPNARNGGMLFAFTNHSKNRLSIAIPCAISLLCAGGMALISFWQGLCAAAFALAALLSYRRMAVKRFGGVTGDTSGFFIQLCELCILFGIWTGSCI